MEDPERPRGPADPDPPTHEVIQPTAEAVAEEICRDILTIHRESYGGGAGAAKAYLLDDMVVVVLDDPQLLPNERLLVESGQRDVVVGLREQFQRAIESTFRAAVERATGRRVIGFSSHVQLDE